MAGLFGGLRAQAAALPPIQQAAPPSRRRGLFGGPPNTDEIGLMERLSLIGRAGQGEGSYQELRRAREAEIETARQAAAARQVEDRLRAQLSPADGPNGSGTGAAPTTEQQTAAINDARLLNPEVANRFAPGVQAQRMDEMTRALPLEQRLAIQLNPESAGQSFASQFKDETLSEGSIRTRGSQTVAGAPVTDRFDDRFGTFDPMTGQTSYSQPRGSTFAEDTARYGAETGRITANRPQIASLSPGQQAFGVTPDGQATPLAQNSTPSAPNPVQTELRSSYDTNQREVIPTLNQMRQSLASGDVITGLGADVQLQVARAAAAAGNRDAQRRVAATEAYRNMSGRLRVGMAKTLGANPSNADIQLLEQITAGNIGQNSESLLATIDQGLAFANRRTADLEAQMGGQGQQQQGSAGGQIYENPQTGERIRWNGTAWVPAQ